MSSDNRRSIRYPVGIRCAFRLHETVGEPVAGTIRDVSRQGLCLETGDDVGKSAETVEIHFATPPGAPAGVLVGEIVQRQKTPLGWALGIAFRDADPAVKWELLDMAYRHWQDRLATAAGDASAPVAGAHLSSP